MQPPMRLLTIIACLFGSALSRSAIAKEVTPGTLGIFETLFDDKLPPKKEHLFVGRVYAQFSTDSYLLCVGVLVSRELIITDSHCGRPPAENYKLDELVVLFQTSPPTVVSLGAAVEKNDKFGYTIYPIAKFEEGSPNNLVPARLIKADLFKEGYVTTYDDWAQPNACRWRMATKDDFLNKKLPAQPESHYTSVCKKSNAPRLAFGPTLSISKDNKGITQFNDTFTIFTQPKIYPIGDIIAISPVLQKVYNEQQKP
jgi:hypothetical protein